MALKSLLLILIFALSFTAQPVFMQDAPADVVHLVLGIEGEAQIALATGSGEYTAPQALTVGTPVHSGDVIFITSGQVTILCANNVIVTLVEAVGSPTCSDENPDRTIMYGDVTVYRSSPRSASVAYAITPRNTLLWEARPVLTWAPYKPLQGEEDATIRYKVELVNVNDQSIVWSQDNVDTTSVAFPFDDPLNANDPADNNLVYELRVTSIVNGEEQPAIDPFSPFGFCVIDPRDREVLTQRLQDVETVNEKLPAWVSEDVRKFRLAIFYYNYELYYDALQVLNEMQLVDLDEPFPPEEVRANRFASSPAFYMILARVYYAMRLPNEMNAAFKRAEELAGLLNDNLSRAMIAEQRAIIARSGLPTISAEDDEEIYVVYENAIALYEQIGDSAGAERVRAHRDAELAPSAPDRGPCSRSR